MIDPIGFGAYAQGMLKKPQAAFSKSWVLNLAVPLLFFICVYGLMPVADTIQFDPDEGIELAKVMLYRQGYTLYEQIWNDQPPLLTILLAKWLGVFGNSIVAARLLILGFAALLVGAFHCTLRLSVQPFYALVGTLGLCLTFGFVRLSVSVMRGLPALALAMLAICWLCLAQTQRCAGSLQFRPLWPWVAASGICFGLSLQIKFVTLLLLPALLGQLFQQDEPKPERIKGDRPHSITIIGLWSLACGLSFLIIGLLTHAFHPEQLIETHLNASTQVHLQREPSWLRLLMFLAQDLDYTLLAGLGIWLLLHRKITAPHLPLYWLVTVLIALSFHQPLWDHYSLMVLIPVVWLATYGLAYSIPKLQPLRWPPPSLQWSRPTFNTLSAGLIALAIALVPVKLGINAVVNHQLVQISRQQAPVIQALMAFQPQTRWLFTDLPIASFYTQLKVPPELAVFSTKRIESGNLSHDVLLKILQTYQPEQVLLGRYPTIQTALQPYLEAHYVQQYKHQQISLYVLKSLVHGRDLPISVVPAPSLPAI
jgi:Dolichyl-phosphate-mannose-protein mannosyltransferase